MNLGDRVYPFYEITSVALLLFFAFIRVAVREKAGQAFRKKVKNAKT